jgi:hypothetical protein
MSAELLAASADHLSGPDAAVTIAAIIAFCFMMWLFLR